MHQLWTIPEIFQHILKSGVLKNDHLVKLVSVSSWFWEIVAPVLWEKPHYYPLVEPHWGFEVLLSDDLKEKLEDWAEGPRVVYTRRTMSHLRINADFYFCRDPSRNLGTPERSRGLTYIVRSSRLLEST